MRSYNIKALWDPESCVWISESDIPGLVIEADTLGEFETLMDELAPEMLAANENLRNTFVSVEFSVRSTRNLAGV